MKAKQKEVIYSTKQTKKSKEGVCDTVIDVLVWYRMGGREGSRVKTVCV